MARDTTRWKQGGFLRVDDRTGFYQWADKTQKEWTGQIVAKNVWEERHTQDFVRGIRDDMRIADPRADTSIANSPGTGPLTATLAIAAVAGESGLTLSSIAGFRVGDTVRVILDEGSYLATVVSVPITVNSPDVTVNSSTTVDSLTNMDISPSLPGPASVGNFVVDLSNVPLPNLG